MLPECKYLLSIRQYIKEKELLSNGSEENYLFI